METWVHPEMREGEMFLSNVRRERMHLIQPWKTARVGLQAYNIAREKLPESFVPIFVSADEYAVQYGNSGKSTL